MKTLIVVSAFMLSACSALPSIKYCDKVQYTRDGTKIILHAECTAPIGGIGAL